GVTDLAGNALAADLTWSFSTAAASALCATPCSLWDAAATPGLVADSDTSAVELGVKFRSGVDGFITGLRFYKSAGNTGPHVGSLWSSGGTLLAQVTFTNETASGWQEASFTSPVAITADTVYVASYHAPVGRYSADTGYFASAYTNGPLTALASSESVNGVYQYGLGGFPTSSYLSTNYWVDVIMTTSSGPDTTPPQVSSTAPLEGAADVSPQTDVKATFDEPIDPATINAATFELRDAGAALVSATLSYDAVTRAATLNPNAALALGTQYTAALKGGTDGIKDLAGNSMTGDVSWTFTTAATDPCTTGNPIVRENCLTGNPPSEWDVSGAGDPSIQGFTTDISVDQGGIVDFKIDTDATDYRLDIYRLGYYGGDGARKVATVLPSAPLPQAQPACLTDSASGLIDCGNWEVSASWSVPADATSGIYFAKAIREDSEGSSHIVFIVRDDGSTSEILFQTSDTTWQAYNTWGGNSLYEGTGPGTGGGADGRAYKVSYNRPFNTREVAGGQDWLFSAEYPMVRWLEANGYDLSYFTGIDSDRLGSLILNHKVFLSVGHDEYWSGQQRANVEAARDAGVHLAFFSANEIFWKTRWEDSVDGSASPYRTLVCYKETHDYPNNPDPEVGVWTGTWRDPRDPTKDGGQPENALTGTIFTVNDGATTEIQVPAEDGKMRFWRDTSIASLAAGTVAFLPRGTLGYEWDEDLDNDFRPEGLIRMSTTTVENAPVLTDFGSTFAPGTATHHLTLYRADSGALVFGSGTIQWPWGLDPNYDDVSGRGGDPADPRMQQATVNLLADMNAQPETLQPGLVAATASTDLTSPSSTITAPAAGTNLPVGTPVTVTGTATDGGGGVVGGVEVSVDSGLTWHPAVGRESWSYTWTPLASGAITIRTRAVDDSGNLEIPGAGVGITIGTESDTTPPTVVATTPSDGAIDVFTGSVVSAEFSEAMDEGTITNGTFELRDAGNTLVAASVSYEAASQTATLTPSSALAAATTYTMRVLGGTAGVTDLAGNALAADLTWSFTTAAPDTEAPTVTSTSPVAGATEVSPSAVVSAVFSEAMDAATITSGTFELRDAGNTLVAASVSYDAGSQTATLTPSGALTVATTYTARVLGGTAGVTDLAGNALAADLTWSFSTAAASALCATPCSLWDAAATPGL
ncbi:MAG: N,N-dimethylformamidase beta subunit family domain-containing protein, partial [Chromatiaceae bacterium]